MYYWIEFSELISPNSNRILSGLVAWCTLNIMTNAAGNQDHSSDLLVLSTGSLRLDKALNLGGIPRGALVEIFGVSASGKTTLCQHVLAEAQKSGLHCVWIDADHTFDPLYASRCGVDIHSLIASEPADAEQALDTIETLSRSGGVGLIILDSLTALVPRGELSQSLGSAESLDLSPILANALPRVQRLLERQGTTLILTNQEHPQFSRVYHQLSKHPSRLALPLMASIRLHLKPLDTFKQAASVDISRISVQVVKNKYSPCAQSVNLDIIVNRGFNIIGELFDLSDELGIFSRREGSIFYNDKPVGSERNQVLDFLNTHPAIVREITSQIRLRLLPNAPAKPA